MRKNRMMRAAAGLLVATLLSTSIIAGTFAKYVTSGTGTDTARVATWGFNDISSITLNDLFKTSYDNNNVKGNKDVIAPGTTNSATFGFAYAGQENAPEVAYTFKVDTTGSTCSDDIQNNKNIVWSLDNNEYVSDNQGTSWTKLLNAIEALDDNIAASEANGNVADYHAPGTLPSGFASKAANQHTVSWKWKFDEGNNDVADTAMGNKTMLDSVTLKISITATQID